MCKNPFEERFLVIAEKPSVAMTIASVLGCKNKRDGYLESPDCAVSWCFGHLADYAMPEAYDEKYRKWSLDDLPIIPDTWKLVVSSDKAKQFRILCDLLNNRAKKGKSTLSSAEKFFVPFDYVVNACDAGREGELIFNRVYELSGSRLPVKRLWISSMEDDAVLQGFMNLRDGEELNNLANASVCRAQADWLVGMNASRAFTKAYDCRFSVGRVQTPTLAMLVERKDQIDHFEKKQYFVTHLLTGTMGNAFDAVSEHFSDREEANRLAGICHGRPASVPAIERQTRALMPPKLYDLTTLQRDANRLFGMNASATLRCAQTLYENKLITYPRTDSCYLTEDMEQTASDVLRACLLVYPFLSVSNAEEKHEPPGSGPLDPLRASRPDITRILDSKKVTDHHAIIPTMVIEKTDLSTLGNEEKTILAMISARLACAVGAKHVYESVKATFLCCGYPFTATGRSIKEMGWKALENAFRKEFCRSSDSTDDGTENEEAMNPAEGVQDLSSLYQGAQFPSSDTKVTDHWTRPAPQFTEDTLLHAMETAGASEMEADVERKGLGTPATRASIIDKLVSSKYAVRKKRQLIATEAGKQLITVLPDYLKSAQMTADWENRLLMMERGRYDRETFMEGITQMLHRMLDECRQISEEDRQKFGGSGAAGSLSPAHEELGKCPLCGSPVFEGDKTFYCSDRNCSFVLWKQNRYLEKLRTSLNAGMVRDFLAEGKTRSARLYSANKGRYFQADLLMEWKDGRPSYSLEFPGHNAGSNS